MEHQERLAEVFYRSTFNQELLSAYGLAHILEKNSSESLKSYTNALSYLLLKSAKGRAYYADIFTDERLRFAPLNADSEQTSLYFRQLFELERDEIKKLNISDTVLAKYNELNNALSDYKNTDKKVLLIGDCFVNELRVFLPRLMLDQQQKVSLDCQYFASSDIKNEIAETIRRLESGYSAVVLSLFTYTASQTFSNFIRALEKNHPLDIDESINKMLGEIAFFISEVRKASNVPIFLHNASGLPTSRKRIYNPFVKALPANIEAALGKLNKALASVFTDHENVILFDEAHVASVQGKKQASRIILPKRYQSFSHTSLFGSSVSKAYTSKLSALFKMQKKKVICVDFDNTLWKGVIGDGDVIHYREKQQLLKDLKQQGMVLIAVSKNSPENIRWNEMVLQPEDFAELYINWEVKYENIKRSAKRLNLGLDSYIFIDDNPMELSLMEKNLPMVLSLSALDDSSWEAVSMLSKLPNTSMTAEAQARTKMYQEQALRAQVIEEDSADKGAAFCELGLNMFFAHAVLADLKRVTELVNRTNQFNTTTIRYSKQDLQKRFKDKNTQIYTAKLSDKFGDLGLVSVLIVTLEGSHATIETFVMSCRAMGYDLEHCFLSEVLQDLKLKGVISVCGDIYPTDRNTPCREIYAELDFVNTGNTWTLSSLQTTPKLNREWITVS